MKGKIKKYLSFRGFGFIESESLENDVFFHISSYPRSALPVVRQEVEFTIIDTEKGPEATEITLGWAADSEVDESIVEKMTDVDDIAELKGIGPKYQELLLAVGVDSIQQLASEKPDDLFNRLNEVNVGQQITKRLPTLENIESWINLADIN